MTLVTHEEKASFETINMTCVWLCRCWSWASWSGESAM